MFDVWAALAWRPGNGQDVEAGRQMCEPMAFEPQPGGACKALLLAGIDGLGRVSSVGGGAGLDLYKDDHAVVDGDDINFTVARPRAAFNDVVAEAAQIATGRPFPPLAERAGTAG